METINSFQIERNIRVHDKIYRKYEQRHYDIFNPIEQERLHKKLEQAIRSIETNSIMKRALDFGCGSGNLTKHLIELGIFTVAADVSKKFLGLVKEAYTHTEKLDILQLNGRDLSNIQDNHFDLVATYSVLHHIPDYLQIIQEMVRVVKSGGIIYIDHEASESYWNQTGEYIEFRQSIRPQGKKTWKRYLMLSKYVERFHYYVLRCHRIVNPRYHVEADIHTFPDDHIEWERVESILTALGCEIILKEDYLLYRKGCQIDIYQKYKNKCNDMCVMIARKT